MARNAGPDLREEVRPGRTALSTAVELRQGRGVEGWGARSHGAHEAPARPASDLRVPELWRSRGDQGPEGSRVLGSEAMFQLLRGHLKP